MHRNAASKLLRRGTQIRPSCQRLLSQSTRIPRTASRSIRIATPSSIHLFSTTSASYKAISPDPTPREPAADNSASPADLSIEEYHQLSEDYMDSIVGKLEELQEDREDVDVEYSVRLTSASVIPKTNHLAGWCPDPDVPSKWHICDKQTTAKQADLALESY